MLRIRTTKTASGKTAVQAVRRHHQKTIVVKHFGSADNNSELKKLHVLADQYIIRASQTKPLFPELFTPPKEHLISLDRLKITSPYHHFAYETLSFFYKRNGFNKLKDKLLQDLSIIRITEPASKIRSLALLKEYFGITYGHTTLYQGLKNIQQKKDEIETVAVEYAKKHLSFDFSLLFYDVTTLYFETHKEDEDLRDDQGKVVEEGLRKNGFSKDHKSNKPQILVGLLVTKEGYPVGVEMFPGKTFEGKTMIPLILKVKEKYRIKNLTVVADAAMLSFVNMQELEKHDLSYIVGARMGSVADKLMKEISQALNKTEEIFYKLKTPHGILICDYSKKRASKDKSDREKQIRRALRQIEQGDPVLLKYPFLKAEKKPVLKLNTKLIEKDELLDGIKGYYTNVTDIPESLIVSRYKDLWHVEKAFRIAKSDLEARPMFHHQRVTIEAHMIIVFVSLCIVKSIELISGISIKRVKDQIWKILDVTMEDTLTKQKFVKRMDTSTNEIAKLVENLKRRNHSTY